MGQEKRSGKPWLSGASRFLYTLVFSPCGETASDVTLGFVEFQDLFDLIIEREIDVLQSFAQVFVDGAL